MVRRMVEGETKLKAKISELENGEDTVSAFKVTEIKLELVGMEAEAKKAQELANKRQKMVRQMLEKETTLKTKVTELEAKIKTIESGPEAAAYTAAITREQVDNIPEQTAITAQILTLNEELKKAKDLADKRQKFVSRLLANEQKFKDQIAVLEAQIKMSMTGTKDQYDITEETFVELKVVAATAPPRL